MAGGLGAGDARPGLELRTRQGKTPQLVTGGNAGGLQQFHQQLRLIEDRARMVDGGGAGSTAQPIAPDHVDSVAHKSRQHRRVLAIGRDDALEVRVRQGDHVVRRGSAQGAEIGQGLLRRHQRCGPDAHGRRLHRLRQGGHRHHL